MVTDHVTVSVTPGVTVTVMAIGIPTDHLTTETPTGDTEIAVTPGGQAQGPSGVRIGPGLLTGPGHLGVADPPAMMSHRDTVAPWWITERLFVSLGLERVGV